MFAARRWTALGVMAMLEPDRNVVGEAHDDDITVCVPPSPVGPLVKDVVQVDVGEQR
jgi:hypothetical protein